MNVDVRCDCCKERFSEYDDVYCRKCASEDNKSAPALKDKIAELEQRIQELLHVSWREEYCENATMRLAGLVDYINVVLRENSIIHHEAKFDSLENLRLSIDILVASVRNKETKHAEHANA